MKKILLLLVLSCTAIGIAEAQTTYFVTTTGNDADFGTSWGAAFLTVQKALSVATSGDEIWVAAGNYFPDEGPGQTDNSAFSTFQMVDGVALYGGFNGTEATLADRPSPLAQTVLSGDLRQDDSQQPIVTDASTNSNITSNAYQVVTVSGLTVNTIIDGFVITAGTATFMSPWAEGGGMTISDDSPITVSNCVFSGNRATTGGGISNSSSFLTLSNCEFSGNLASNGGGMFNFGDGITITGCTYSNNTANSIGGGMYNTFGSPVLTDCTFSDNEADTGGGMYVDSSSPSISGCTFSGNTASAHGGGMYNVNGGSPTISNCTFSNNTAVLDGGGMYNSSGSPVVTNSMFIGNTGNNSGGGMSNFFVTMNITNCVFSGNKGGNGGGMNNFQSSLNIYNCTITGNTTNIGGGGGNGGGINNEQSSPTITNCIIWNNLAGDPSGEAISNDFFSNPTISNTIIPFGCAWRTDLGTDGGNNLSLDPQFITPVDPATAPTTTTGNLRLMTTSPAINRGDNSIVTVPPFLDDGMSNPVDLDGNARIQVTTVDMGAYEENTGAATNPIVVSPIIYVDADANPGGNGSSWATAYNSLTDAVEEACACGDKEIWVADGIYYPTQNFDGTSFGLTDPSNTFKLCNTVAIYGGFSGWSGGTSGGSDETMLSQRNITTNVTILSGDLQQDDSQQPIITDPTTNFNNFDNAYSVVTGSNTDNTAILDGFTITAGNNFNFFNTGGGISIENGSPIIRNNHITGNNTSSNGGGMANTFGAAPMLINNSFTNNNSSGNGGGIYNGGASATIIENMFTGNNANGVGGAIYNENATNVTITNASITDNSAFDGGGMYNFQSTSTVTNSVISANNASRWGGGMYNGFNSSPAITNSVFSGNAATESGGGIYNTSSSSPTIINSTISGNLAGDFGGGIYNETSSNPTITNSIIWNNQADGVINSTNATIYNDNATPTIANSILYFNCDWDNALGTDGGNNKSVNPQFITSIDPTTAPTTTGDLRLQPTSPAINMGNNSVVTIPPFLDDGMSNAIDLDGNERIQLSNLDIGAYEENTGGTGSVVTVSSVIYVDTDAAPGGDGSSWAMAYNNVQDALEEACLCGNKEIWVADGTYYPTQNSAGTSTGATDRTNTFQLCNTVEIYGGFSGWSGGTSGGSDETLLNQRDVVANVTILSGDIDQDDVAFDPLTDSDSDTNTPTQTDHLRGNNAYTVVTGSGTDATAILDGFTVTGGASNFSFSDVASGAGAGMINDGGSPTIRNNTFSGNYADNFGGGMYNLNSSNPEITNCNFIGNYAVTGGGMYNRFTSNPTITNCTFENNNAFNNGGGLVNDDVSPTITNSRFLNNTASTGGGIANLAGASPPITNCVFSGNNVFFNGGGMLNSLSSPTIINCVFSGNNAGVHGGGISNETNSSPQIINNTFSGNNADGVGGGIYNQSNSNPSITNSIIWNNQANGQINTTRASIAIDDTNTSTATISHSILPFGCNWDTELGIDGGNNKSVNPQFVTPIDPTTAPTTSGDLRLLPASSAINMGDNSVVIAPPFPDDGSSNPVDLDGNARIQVSTVDIGAYEENTGSTGTPVPPLPSNYFVDADAPSGGDGLSWATAFDNLQDALSAACGCGTVDIWVADGTYYPDEGTGQLDDNSNSTFTLCNNVGIYGGFSGWSGGTSGGSDETLLSQRDFLNNVAILNGDLMQNDVANIQVDQLGVEASRSDNAFHVVTASNTDNTAILDGVTITNGNASGGSFVLGTGGGIFMENATPQINNNILIHNSATFAAGGMYNDASSPTIVNTSFIENYSRSSGGGMYNDNSSSPVITDCDFTGNGAFTNGGAIYNVDLSSLMITGSDFTNNNAGTSGGGLHNQESGMVTIETCTFTGNTATSSDAGAIFNSLGNMSIHDTEFTSNSSPGAGAISHSSSTLTITNSRFISNSSTGSGGAMRIIDSSPEIINTSFIGNSAIGNGGVMFNQSGVSPTIINCIFTGNSTPADGGVMYNDFNSSPNITNCTFTGNNARSGGVLFNTRNSSPIITNSIIWNNQASGIIDNSNASIFNSNSSPIISYTIIPYGCIWDVALGIDGGNNINADPQLITPVDPTTAPTTSGDVRLMPTSPAIERGDNSVVTVPPFPEDGMSNPIDLDGNARIQVATVDMGAYEENTGATINPVASVPAPVIDAVTPATCDAPGEISFVGTLGANEAYFVSTDGVNFFELTTATIPIPAGQATAVSYQIKTVNTVTGCESEVVTVNVDPVVYYTITTTGGNLVITDNCNNGETLTLSENAGNIRIENFNPTRTYQIDGGAITAFSTPAEVPIAGLLSITVNAEGGDDIINLGAFSANLPSLTLNGGTGNDQVNFNGDITFATNANLDLDLQNDDALPGADRVALGANVDVLTQGMGTITVKVSRDIELATGSTLQTTNGAITLEANQQAVSTNEAFAGITIEGTIGSVGAGAVTVIGKAGSAGNNTSGVRIYGANAKVISSGGDISVIGQGNSDNSFGVILNHGVEVINGGNIMAGGMGTVTVEGTGGPFGSSNEFGVVLSGTGSQINSSGGNVKVTGQGGGSSTAGFSEGVFVGGIITAGGTGTVTVEGTGGSGTGGDNIGIEVRGPDGQITSSGGDVLVIGRSSAGSQGVFLSSGGIITAGGMGMVTLEGTGGLGDAFGSSGVEILGATSQITSSGGNVLVKGFGGGSGTSFGNSGVSVGGIITAGGDGTVTVEGTGGDGSGGSHMGVVVNGQITSSGGHVMVTGQGGGSGSATDNYGVAVFGGEITAGGNGTVTVEGTGGATEGDNNYGVNLQNTGSLITSSGGNVTVKGFGGGIGASAMNHGVFSFRFGTITASGMGKVTVEGTGGATAGNENIGVYLLQSTSRITSSGGDVMVTGEGGGSGASGSNVGVQLGSYTLFEQGGTITAGGNGSVMVTGTGGSSEGDSNDGVAVLYTNSTITSSGGAVSVNGTGGGSSNSNNNYGVNVTAGGKITAGLAGAVNVDGTGGSTAGMNNYGVFVGEFFNSQISSTDGPINVIGQGGNGAPDILLENNGNISTSSTTAGITLQSTTNGTYPSTTGTDVSTAATQKTAFAAGSKLNIDIDGLFQYQELRAVGMVDLTGAILTFNGSTHTPAVGNTFLIVNNDDTDPVIGTFQGLPEGGAIPNFLGSGLFAQITYIGGNGNDVVLSIVDNVVTCTVPVPELTPATCDAAGQIAFTSTLGTNEAYFVSTDGGNTFEELMTATIPLPQGSAAAVSYQIKTVNSIDNCESEVVTVNMDAVTCGGGGDPCENDNTPPMIVCPEPMTLDCGDDLPGPLTELSGTDNCDEGTLIPFQGGTQITTQYTDRGVEFSPGPYIFNQGQSLPSTFIACSEPGTVIMSLFSEMDAIATQGTWSSFSMCYTSAAGSCSLEAFDASDNSLGSVFGVANWPNGSDILNISFPGMARVKITAGGGGANMSMDDVTFTIESTGNTEVINFDGELAPAAFQVVSVEDTPTAPNEVTRTYTVEDEAGNEASCTQIFTFNCDMQNCTSPVVVLNGSATICSTKKLALADLQAMVTYDGEASELQYTWSIKEVGMNGTFSETDSSNPNAGFYMPGKAAIERGSVTLILTVVNPNDDCEGDSAEVVVDILKVDCGSFPWRGNK